MQELIKYFETIETRLATLEAKEQELKALEERLCKIEKAQQDNLVKLQAVGVNVNTMLQTLKTIEVKKSEAVHVAAPVISPKPVIEAKVEEPTPQPVVEVKVEEPAPQPVVEVESKAAIYGKTVDDIRQAISIGDRFLFQRELFEQNAELMQRTLKELDQLSSFDAALDYINMHFQWDQESNTYQQFIVTLHRRFG